MNWIKSKYERLGDFCHRCGKLSHISRNHTEKCQEELEEDDEGCGPLLKAVSVRNLILLNAKTEIGTDSKGIRKEGSQRM